MVKCPTDFEQAGGIVGVVPAAMGHIRSGNHPHPARIDQIDAGRFRKAGMCLHQALKLIKPAGCLPVHRASLEQ